MDEDIIADLDRYLSNVNSDKYWPKKVGDLEIWFSTVSYEHSNLAKKSLQQEEFGLEETKRVILSASIVGVNGLDLRHLRLQDKPIRVKGSDGKTHLLSLQEFIYKRIAKWDDEFVVLAYDVFNDLMISHNKDMAKDLVFENARTPLEELEELEERVANARQKLGLPPLVEATRLADPIVEEDAGIDGSDSAAAPEGLGASEDGEPVEAVPPGDVDFVGSEEDFDPFKAVKAGAARVAPQQPARPPRTDVAVLEEDGLPVPPRRSPAVPVPVPPSADPGTPSAIELALEQRRRASPLSNGVAASPAQPSVPVEVIEKPSARVQVQPPRLDPKVSQQSANPRFRRKAP
jgi:hypothetical protein